MSFQDKSIQCAECNAAFTFSVQDQEYFQTKGFTNEPKRCPTCRQTRRAQTGNAGYGNAGPRQMFPATCADCGKSTEVPFEPRNGKPVYCSDCFKKVRI
jgi:CxxC-x17-CxxC domain-containing protein